MLDCVGREELVDYILKMLETSLEIMRIRQGSKSEDENSVLKHIIIIDLFGLALQVQPFCVFLYLTFNFRPLHFPL